jgi:hypothetical protein
MVALGTQDCLSVFVFVFVFVRVRVRVPDHRHIVSIGTRRTIKDFASSAVAGSTSACMRRRSKIAAHWMAESRAVAW